ncbi:MAG TPA: CsbD family protein, partial [Xanthobacteraceae bacterium]|nr:CsbD family protein [Xanthobacteraceae bacterium]
AQQAKGKIKELAGKAVGNRKLQARGKTEKAGGKIRNAVGGMKDAMRAK